MAKKNHTWGVFTHWANLTFLGGSVLAGMAFGWPVVALAALAEGLALWSLPDIPAIKRSLDAEAKGSQFEDQRRYYLRKIFDEAPKAPTSGVLSFFVSKPTDWALYGQVLSSRKRDQYNRLVAIVKELKSIREVHPDRVNTSQIQQIDQAINTWLNLVYIAKTLAGTLTEMEPADLEEEALALEAKLKQAEGDRAETIVLQQRLLNLNQKVTARPKLESRRGLALAQAEKIFGQAEAFLSTVKTSGQSDPTALDFMVDHYQLLEGGMDTAAVQNEIHMLTSNADQDLLSEVMSGLDTIRERSQPSQKNSPRRVTPKSESDFWL